GRGGRAPAAPPPPSPPGPRRGWRAVQNPLQVVSPRRGRVVAPPRIFFETLQTDRFQIPVDPGIDLARRLGIALQNLQDRIQWRLRPERRAPRGQRVEKGAPAVDVHARRHETLPPRPRPP